MYSKHGEHGIKTTLFRILCRKNNKASSRISSLFFAFMVIYHPVSSRHHAQAFQNMDAFQRPAFHQVFLSENMSFVEASNCEFIIQFITLLVAFDRLYVPYGPLFITSVLLVLHCRRNNTMHLFKPKFTLEITTTT